MYSPELPRTILPTEAFDDIIATRMDSRKVRAVIDNLIYHDPLDRQYKSMFQNDLTADTQSFESPFPCLDFTVSAGMKGKSSLGMSFEQG